MQQYNVPQFVEIEDKIFGPFTLRQFLSLVMGGIFVLAFWGIFDFGIAFWFLSVPTALIFLFIAVGSFNGRPALDHVFPIIGFIAQPKKLTFHRGGADVVIKKREEKVEGASLPAAEVRSRLHRLAYVLDQKEEKQEELISKVPSLQ